MAIHSSIFHTSEELQSASTLNQNLRNFEHPDRDLPGAQLLELRSDAGSVYVCPNRWQRLRLQWIFRHFHVLPPQLLGRRGQRLIEKLSQSAVLNPAQPVAGSIVIGVVESVGVKAPASRSHRVVKVRTNPAAWPSPPAKPNRYDRPVLSQRVQPTESAAAPTGPKAMSAGLAPWRVFAVPAAVGFALVMIWIALQSKAVLPNTEMVSKPASVAAAVQPAANHVRPPAVQPATSALLAALPAIAPAPVPEKPKKRVAATAAPEHITTAVPAKVAASLPVVGAASVPAAAPASGSATIPDVIPNTIPTVTPAILSAPPALRYVAELPPGHFAHPSVGDRNLVGELQLQALIGADGSVKKVTVLSGSPALAEIGMRAVRQWRYSPYEVLGTPVEVETHIRMSFFGEDAVSIASVAGGSASQAK